MKMISGHTKIYVILAILCLSTALVHGQNILSLEEAMATTLQNNFNILIAKNQSEMAAVNNTPGNAGFLPNVDLGIGQNFNINNTDLKFFSGETRGGTNQIDNINANVILGWTIFDGMLMFINRDRLRKLEMMGKNQWRLQIENAVFETMTIYYNLEQQRKRIQSVEEAIALSSERLQLARTKKSLGKATESDILSAEVDILADSSLLIQEKWNYENLKVALNESMGINPETPFEIEDSPPLPPLDLQKTREEAFAYNTELILADQNITLSELQLRQWKARLYPEVQLNGAYNFNRQTAQIGLLQFNRTSGLAFGLTASWNLFNGLNNRREMQWSKLNMQNQLLARDQMKNTIHADIVTTINEYQTAMQLSVQEDRNLMVARKNVDLAQERLNVGVITYIELRQAQLNLTQVQFRKITADFNARMADLRLRRLSGKLWKNE